MILSYKTKQFLFVTDPNAAYLRRTSLYFRHSGMFLAGLNLPGAV